MKVLPFKIPKPELDALVYQVDLDIAFYDQLHQHEEIQLSLVVEGEGTLIVGDTINDYAKGDILVIGSNLPHVFKSDLNVDRKSHMLTLFFTKTAFGTHFFNLEELHELEPFFKRAAHGFKVTSNKAAMRDLFFKLETASKLNRFIILLELLKIASTAPYKSLSSFIYDKKYTDVEGKRMRDVFEYTMTNYHKEISLEAIANIANMTKNAFCKYFKKRTNKTYFSFLNELRIENACKLLLSHKELPIIAIAEQSGFHNISNFNRQFKAIKGLSPNNYRKENQ
ncbi:AraC family transcriptional regulator [Snuella sedimenti]|uniref:Helix-turn-helix domain-containing protein n=1 Tax=Snuella sedimenti TaxID=2798802 RepID=A0A8J7LY08_9FLAO|nr:AraC family transcriptional regulator [Snuella sedimenti]MBJ6367736.1 helix-turn-helix domain-containing protein [Snuella sedimenti]